MIGFSLLGIYMIVMMGFVNAAYRKQSCKGIEVVVKDSTVTQFIRPNDVHQMLKKANYEITGKHPADIKLHKVESTVKQHVSIRDCECYFLTDGRMRIEVLQRHPIARVLSGKMNFYIDEIGGKMTPSGFYTAHVPVITGAVKTEQINSDLFHIANTIYQDEFWRAQIVQINVTPAGEYILIPRAGRQTIELGNAENLDTKFKSLKALYLQIFNNNAWNKYKTISLKYDGQVVCTKKE